MSPAPGARRPLHRVHLLLAALLLFSLALSGLAQAQPGQGKGVGPGHDARTLELTVMGTTDIHGHVWDWDYFRNAPFSTARGLAHISTLVNELRAERGADSTLLVDAGDTLQGTLLAYYYANIERDVGMTANPIAKAMNHMGYAASAVGNHEFNYGIDYLDAFVDQLDFPLLSANTVKHGTDEPAYPPYVIERVKVRGHRPVDVGIIGFTPPGVIIWDRRNVEGELEFLDIVESAKRYVPELDRKTDLIVAVSHSGLSGTSSYGPEVPLENASAELAAQVPGIDAIVVGHSHTSIPEQFITNEVTGEDVLITQPQQHGRELSVMDFTLKLERGRWTVDEKGSHTRAAATVPADPDVLALTHTEHDATVTYVNTPIGASTAEWSSFESVYKDTPIIDLIQVAQIAEVEERFAAIGAEDLPILSLAAAFTRTAYIPEGDVTIADIASLYIYDNTLLAVELTGAQIKDYLEFSAKYFKTPPETGDVNPEEIIRAGGERDYNYDMLYGVTYDIDIAKPLGERIVNLEFEGAPIEPAQRFAVALNNYRQSGGGNFPHVTNAPVLLDEQREVRQLIIDYVAEQGVIDPDDVFVPAWRITRHGEPLFD